MTWQDCGQTGADSFFMGQEGSTHLFAPCPQGELKLNKLCYVNKWVTVLLLLFSYLFG